VPEVLLVMAGAAVGAPLRWWVDRAVQRRFAPLLPWGTFAVNVTGSLLLGVLAGAHVNAVAGDGAVLLLGVGLLGSLTTFSSFGWETHRLAEDGAEGLALLNVVGSVVACLAAAWCGWQVGTAWIG
jgi:CrcB protein